MKLNWNIHYQIVSKYIYPINAQLIFEIPITNSTVYMKQDLLDISRKYIVLLDTLKFIQAWRTSTNDDRFPNYHIEVNKFGVQIESFIMPNKGLHLV